jgi:hypothetical protein
VNVPAVIIWKENDPTTPIRTGKLLNYILPKLNLTSCLNGEKAAVQAAISGSRLIFSVSKIESPFNHGDIHGYYAVGPETPL